MKKFIVVLGLSFLMSGFLSAQYFEAGVMGGVSVYRGDLSPNNFFRNFELVRPAAGIFARYNVNDFFSTKFQFNYTILSGSDELEGRVRNLAFNSNIFEFGFTGEFNILGYQPYNLYRPFSPYLFAGINFFSFNPTATINGTKYDLQPLGTEGQGLAAYPGKTPYSRFQVAIPLGIGAKYAINDTWNIGLEIGYRLAFTDYIDDVSTTYPDLDLLLVERGEAAVIASNRTGTEIPEGVQRGNPQNNDGFLIIGISVSYNFIDNGLVGSRGRRSRGRGCYN